MDSTDLGKLERRVRLAYEFGRLRRALLGVAPVFGVVLVAVGFGHRPGSALAFGAATLTFGALMLWYGREPQRAFLPGVVAGLAPLALALCANHVHACGANGCSSLCVPACALGGLVAGFAVAGLGHRRKAGLGFWLGASALALLTGAMGCACIGYTGLVGLGVGFGTGLVPGVLQRVFAGNRR